MKVNTLEELEAKNKRKLFESKRAYKKRLKKKKQNQQTILGWYLFLRFLFLRLTPVGWCIIWYKRSKTAYRVWYALSKKERVDRGDAARTSNTATRHDGNIIDDIFS